MKFDRLPATDYRKCSDHKKLGGIDLDVRKARFAEREVSLTLNAIMGGINVILPEDVAVTCKGTAILGGVEVMGKGSGRRQYLRGPRVVVGAVDIIETINKLRYNSLILHIYIWGDICGRN
ncbi:MAG: LiaF-related protein [Desulfotomaculaceae bacterium]|nr:LiaF-related protein [Desulfotomaculaceae bacterium]